MPLTRNRILNAEQGLALFIGRLDLGYFKDVESHFADIEFCNHWHELARLNRIAVHDVLYLHFGKFRGTP